jgi:hypothetical protein
MQIFMLVKSLLVLSVSAAVLWAHCDRARRTATKSS